MFAVRRVLAWWVAVLGAVGLCIVQPAHALDRLSGAVHGPPRTEVPILRPVEGYPRIFVQVELPDGEPGLFLVDTGADVSVLSRSTAERLGLDIEERFSKLAGLSGDAWMDKAVLPSIGFGPEGERVVEDVVVAVGVRGMSDEVQFLPLDGLLGNNVWSRFVVDIDYPRNQMVLYEPDGFAPTARSLGPLAANGQGRKAAPMLFDGAHVYSPLELTTDGAPGHTDTVIAQVDTGAGGLKLCARTGVPFEAETTEGLESIRGIGASETLPPHRFLQMTRRIPLRAVTLGGEHFAVEQSAQWMYFDQRDTDQCPAGMRALLGHEYLSQHRVIFDYENGQLALMKSKGKPRPVNGHAIVLAQDIERYGPDAPDRTLFRAKLNIGAGNQERAMELLQRLPEDAADTPEARVLLARMYRLFGELDKAWEALEPLGPEHLVDEEEIVGAVNGLLFEGRAEEALALAQAAVEAKPEEGDALVARADALLFLGRADEASSDLGAAAALEEYPDAHLIRRARVALARGDRYGAMAHVRKLLRLYPMGGEFLWFYATLVEDPRDVDTFRTDMDEAMARLHPEMQPIDFKVAALHAIGEDEAAQTLMHEGIERLCDQLPDGVPEHENCTAWFQALAGVRLDEALRSVRRALDETGDRSDFLDTLAVVHLARGEYEEATEAAWAAARQSPADVYMLWQAERIRDIRDREAAAKTTTPETR